MDSHYVRMQTRTLATRLANQMPLACPCGRDDHANHDGTKRHSVSGGYSFGKLLIGTHAATYQQGGGAKHGRLSLQLDSGRGDGVVSPLGVAVGVIMHAWVGINWPAVA